MKYLEEHTMKYLIRFLAIIGLVSMSQLAVAIDNVLDGDLLTADGVNVVIDATNANSSDIRQSNAEALIKELIEGPVEVTSPPPTCGGAVGDTGSGGGLVFLISTDGCKGLEASESDLSDVTVGWGCKDVLVGASKEGYGGGSSNTGYIIDAACTDGSPAATLANDYMNNGFTDWYLPSRDELQEMYAVIGPGADNAGGFQAEGGNAYWTSSEDSQDNALQVVFTNGNSNPVTKTFKRFVRAVRIFENQLPDS
jgi:hypothetical protein